MIGYKGMNLDMTCLGMKYEVGETYYANGEIELCENGFHFCEKLTDVFDFYNKHGSRFFLVESGEDVKTDGRKYVTSKLTILEEVPEKEVNRAFYDNGYGYGYCYGKGYGCGYGKGYGDGYGNGYGNGYCYGYGYGNGFGYGYGIDTGDSIVDRYSNIQKILIFN